MADEGLSDGDVAAMLNEIKGAVTKALNAGNPGDAIKAACAKGPLPTKDQGLKDQLSEAVIPAIAAVKEKEMEGIIGKLSQDEQDTLMKFIYKGLADGSNPSLLKFHEKLFGKAGYGVIVRALTERPTV